MNDNQDHSFRNSLFNPRMHIKQEVISVDDSSVPSSSISQNEDSSLLSVSSLKIKQDPDSKLHSLKKSLELNTTIREVLVEEIGKLKAIYAKNLENQAILKKVLDEEKSQSKSNLKPPSQIRAISVFATPYFRDPKRMIPPINNDTVTKRKNGDVNAYLKPPRPWTQGENKSLLDGVTAYALLSALLPLKRQRNNLRKKLKDKDISDSEIEEIKDHLILLDEEIKNVNEKPLHELLAQLEGKIDWMTISATNLQGGRTPEECEYMWNNYLDFKINKESFAEAEDKKLQDLVEDYNERDWDAIAASLQTNRTAIQCFERYQTRLNPNLRKKYWTKEEDERLIALVNEHKCGELIPWNKISLLMEGRTRQQVINRYQRSVSQQFNRGPWTPEEDAILIACYGKFGTHWYKMKEFFKRRSTYSIRERYVNALDPTIRMCPWTREEDRKLIILIKKYGYGKWSKICKKLPGRTDNMCLIRAGRLLEYSVKYHSDNGSGEYDPGINDPELFARILKPCPITKHSIYRSARLRSYRENGVRLLLKALETVVPDFTAGEEENVISMDFSWISLETLHQLSKKLHEMLDERLQGKPPFVPQFRYMIKPPLKRKRESEESDDDEKYQASPEKKIPFAEKVWTDRVLNTILEMCGKIIMPITRKTQVYNSREIAEISLYKAYLFKQFRCLALCGEHDDLENVKFGNVDFSETLQTVVSYFVQPPVNINQFIVLTPNVTTMLGMEAIEATENRLLSMSECVSHSKTYINYLCERRQSCPKCLQCLHRSNSGELESSMTTPDSVVSEMTKKFFVVDEAMENSAYVEGGSQEKCFEICSCESMAASQKYVRLLRKRFEGLFLWPSLFAGTNFNKEQENILCTESYKEKNYFYRMNTNPEQRTRQGHKKENRKGIKRVLKEEKSEDLPKTKVLKVKVKRSRKVVQPTTLRRSSRSCVVNRSSFSYQEQDRINASELSLSKKSIGSVPSLQEITNTSKYTNVTENHNCSTPALREMSSSSSTSHSSPLLGMTSGTATSHSSQSVPEMSTMGSTSHPSALPEMYISSGSTNYPPTFPVMNLSGSTSYSPALPVINISGSTSNPSAVPQFIILQPVPFNPPFF